MIRLVTTLSIFAFAAASPALAQGSTRHADSHVHGQAQLLIVLTGADLSVELQSPAINLFGFEHEAKTDAEKKTVADARKAAADPAKLVALPAAAQCRLKSAAADFGGDHAHHGHAEGQDDHAHRDVSATQSFTCSRPERLTQIEATALATFPGISALEATWLGPRNQTSRRLDRSTRTLALK